MNFKEKYGPWAVVAGASEGTGRAFARQIAGHGIPSILIARREAPLKALADEIRAETGVACVTAAIDLGQPGAADKVIAAAGNREIGLYISNAGADPNGKRFLDNNLSNWLELMRRNVETVMVCCHHFGTGMRARKRGGILLVNSGAAYCGASFLGVYSGSKAFELSFAEGLWAELKPHNVDVMTLMMSTTDTPELRRLLGTKNLPLPPSAASADKVAAFGLEKLPDGPVWDWSEAEGRPSNGPYSNAQIRERIQMIDRSSAAIFGKQ